MSVVTGSEALWLGAGVARRCSHCDVAWRGNPSCWLCYRLCPPQQNIGLANGAGPNPRNLAIVLSL